MLDYLIFEVHEEERFQQEVKETNLEEAAFVTDQRLDSSKFAKKLTRMPPCRHWLHW